MSFDVQSTLQLQFFNNAGSLATVTVVVYDYVLAFPSEVDHIWNKSWTWVTMLYFIVRYAGIYSVMSTSLFGTTFVSGPVKVSAGFSYSGRWAFTAFAASSTLLLVLRIYAMWNRSKVILTILLLCYTAGVAFELVFTAVFVNPDIDATVGTSQVLGYSFCTEVDSVISPYMKYVAGCVIIFDGLFLILAFVPLAKQSIARYKATRRWEPNQYMSLIVKEGVVYVVLIFLTYTPGTVINPLPYVWNLILQFVFTITMFPIVPRLVISMRKLFDEDSRGQLEGIDSAFGISSRSGNVAGRDASVSGISFADWSSHPGEEDEEEIQFEAVGGNDLGA